MATKKIVNSTEKPKSKPIENKKKDEKLSFSDVRIIVDTIAEASFVENNGKLEYAPEIVSVLIPYFEIGAFYPDTNVLNGSLEEFFTEYIDGKYDMLIEELKNNRLAQYIEKAARQKIEYKSSQIDNPLITSLANLVGVITAIANNYADDINSVGTDDLKKFLKEFNSFAKKTNPATIADKVVEKHIQLLQSEEAVDSKQATPRKRK